jgi:hypothetical protein
MLAHIFPVARHESKELYREGHKMREGVFVRQNGESMQAYILRRKRWWQLLRQLDDTIVLTDEHLGDMLLDASNIQGWQRQMILTSTANSTSFANVEKALMDQMGTVHKKENRDHPSSGKGYGKSFTPLRRPFRKAAYIAEEELDEDEHLWMTRSAYNATCDPDEDLENENYDETYDDEVDDEMLAWELNKLVETEEIAYLAESDITPNNIADVIQSEEIAFAAWDRIGKGGKGKGKGGGKSGGKSGKGKGKSKSFGVRLGGVSLEERKARLIKLKQQTKCSKCGEKGHWAADPECPMNSSSHTSSKGSFSKSPPLSPTGFCATNVGFSASAAISAPFEDCYCG